MTKKTTTYQEDLIGSLKDLREAAAYLNAAMEEGDRALFLLALRNVAEAHGGMAAVAEKAQLNRENLYRTLSKKRNPEIKSIVSLLHSMGLSLTVEPRRKVTRSRAKCPTMSMPRAFLAVGMKLRPRSLSSMHTLYSPTLPVT